MERSYGYLSNFFQKKHFLITHIRDLHYKGLDIPSSIPLITQGFSSHPYMMKELRLPLDFSSTLFKIINLYYFISNIFYFKKGGTSRSNEKDVHPHAHRHTCTKFLGYWAMRNLRIYIFCSNLCFFLQYIL